MAWQGGGYGYGAPPQQPSALALLQQQQQQQQAALLLQQKAQLQLHQQQQHQQQQQRHQHLGYAAQGSSLYGSGYGGGVAGGGGAPQSMSAVPYPGGGGGYASATPSGGAPAYSGLGGGSIALGGLAGGAAGLLGGGPVGGGLRYGGGALAAMPSSGGAMLPSYMPASSSAYAHAPVYASLDSSGSGTAAGSSATSAYLAQRNLWTNGGASGSGGSAGAIAAVMAPLGIGGRSSAVISAPPPAPSRYNEPRVPSLQLAQGQLGGRYEEALPLPPAQQQQQQLLHGGYASREAWGGGLGGLTNAAGGAPTAVHGVVPAQPGREKEWERELRERERGRESERDVPTRSDTPHASVVEYECKPPVHLVTQVERVLSDVLERYPRLHVPSDFTHCVAAWVHTLPPPLSSTPPTLIVLGEEPVVGEGGGNAAAIAASSAPAAPPAAGSGAGANESGWPYSLPLHAMPIVIDNERVTVPDASSAATANGDPGTATTLPSPVSGALPVRFNVRVLLMGAGGSGGTPRPLDLRVLVSKRRGGLQLLGGPWSEVLDGGNPLTGDAPLVRAGVRHVRAQTGVDLSPCREWLKLLAIHYHRPSEVVRGAAYAEQLEVSVVLLCLDASPAAHRYALHDGGGWVAVSLANASDAALCDMRIDELRAECRSRGLRVTGKKPELLSRLRSAAAGCGDEGGTWAAVSGGPPPAPCLRAVAPLDPDTGAPPTAATGGGGVRHKLVSLDGLLDYEEGDKLERTFEVSLAAEALWELCARDAAHAIAAGIAAANAEGGGGEGEGAVAAAGTKRKALTDAGANAAGGNLGLLSKRPRSSGEGGDSDGDGSASLLAAFRFFDRTSAGFLTAGDLELILTHSGLRLSRWDLRALLLRAAGDAAPGKEARIPYAPLVRLVGEK